VVTALSAAAGPGVLGDRPAGAEEAIVIDDPRLDPSLAGVQVSGDGYQKALAAYRVAAGRLADAETRLARTDEVLTELSGERARLDAEIDVARAQGETARADLERHQSSLRAVAVAAYVQGRDGATDTLLGGAEEAATTARQDAMVGDVTERRSAQVRQDKAVIDDTDRTIAADTGSLTDVEARITDAAAAREEATTEVDGLSAAAARASTADWRLTADVLGSDLPLIALDAYVKAAGRMSVERPECGLRWTGLAAIGKVESGHGTYGGSRLSATGATSQPIVGIPLDGTAGTAAIGDTDGGEIDGDPTTDRAVGPMQFIPGSWRGLGRDGNGDGRADPNNIYDAALAAAGLLCRAAGTGLDTDAGLYRAALSYNNSASYASLVVRHAKAYAAQEATLIPPPPTTTTTVETPPPTVPPTTPLPGTAPAAADPSSPPNGSGPP